MAKAQRGVTQKSLHTVDRVEDTLGILPGEHPVLSDPGTVTYGAEQSGPYGLLLTAKCRKCEQCLRERAWLWRNRAQQEIARSGRTWFVTLTLSPANHEVMANRARARASKRRREPFESLSEHEQFAARHREIMVEFTLAIKRLRKSGLRFRYMVVAEAHKSGLPHYHCLLHEFGTTITQRAIKEQWALGFTTAKLVDEGPKAAFYCSKYLAKSASARVRASQGYGRALMVRMNPLYQRGKKVDQGGDGLVVQGTEDAGVEINHGDSPGSTPGATAHSAPEVSSQPFLHKQDAA